MILQVKEMPKQKMDKSKINAWICCSMDIEKGNLNKIQNRVMTKAKTIFIWNSEIEEYIINQVSKIEEVN